MKILIKSFVIAVIVSFLMIAPTELQAQAKKEVLTNAKIIELVRLGLSEGIIVEKIRQSECQCDTSSDGLAQLKAAKVSDAVIMAMLNSTSDNAGKSPPKSNKNDNALIAEAKRQGMLGGQPDMDNSAEMPISEVIIIDGSKRISMKRSQTNVRSGTLGAMVPVFGKAKIKAALNGNHAQLCISDNSPTFEISLPSDVNAADQLVLIKLNTKSDRREIEIARGGALGTSTGFRKDSIVPITFEEIKTQTLGGAARYTLYRVKVVNPLSPGEYAFAPQNFYYDFGVDGGQ